MVWVCMETGSGSGARGGAETSPALPPPPPPPPTHSPLALLPHNGHNKILGRNANSTMVVTTGPSNPAELQLYRVLQRASLLSYFDTLLDMGGDDVQQLCDAGEEEFLEIMSLVGMASKPLHVRRLQKALQEWIGNPALFQVPLVPVEPPRIAAAPVRVPSPDNAACALYSPSPEPAVVADSSRPHSPHSVPPRPCSSASSPSPGTQISPNLNTSQIEKLSTAAERLGRRLPRLEPRPQNHKKKVCKELDTVLNMADDDPRRMDQIRKYAAIYGRFDCKRKPEKPLTLHEVSVNEAAAQICRVVPALLTRRDELFPLARQVVRLSGFHCSSSKVSPTRSESESSSGGGGGTSIERLKRSRSSESTEATSPDNKRRPEDVSGGDDVIRGAEHCYQSPSLPWTRPDSEDGDSRYSFSNSNSPAAQEPEETASASGEAEGGPVQVVAASGDHIIAVANPALALLSRTSTNH